MSLKLANLIGIPVVGLHQGQRTYTPRHQAGHMTAADQTVQREKVLAMRPSTYVSQALTPDRSLRFSIRVVRLSRQFRTRGARHVFKSDSPLASDFELSSSLWRHQNVVAIPTRAVTPKAKKRAYVVSHAIAGTASAMAMPRKQICHET